MFLRKACSHRATWRHIPEDDDPTFTLLLAALFFPALTELMQK